jgi:hypothetical protein
MTRDRAESGEFVETITLDRVVEAIREVEAPVVTTRDIADSLGCTTEAARQKLMRLVEQGRADRRKVGSRAVIWWLTEFEETATEISPDDPLFNGGPIYASDDPIDETEIDDVLYGDI